MTRSNLRESKMQKFPKDKSPDLHAHGSLQRHPFTLIKPYFAPPLKYFLDFLDFTCLGKPWCMERQFCNFLMELIKSVKFIFSN